MQEGRVRRAIDAEDTWDLQDIYTTPGDWHADFPQVETDVARLLSYQGRFREGGAVLVACLQARDAVLARLNKLTQYADLQAFVDATSTVAQVMGVRAHALEARVLAALAFIEPEMLGLAAGILDEYLTEEPRLHAYRSQLEEIVRRRQHTLTAKAEGVLAALAETLDAPFAVWQQTMAADLVFPPTQDRQGQDIPLSISQYRVLEQAADREVRRRAYASLTTGLMAHKATLAATLIACIKRTVTLAQLRHYPSAAAMILAPQQVPVAVYRTSLDLAHAEAAPHLQRLMRVRSRLLGVEPLAYFDLVAPLGPDAAPSITRSAGVRLLQEALHPLGDAYSALLHTAVAKRWIDWADNQGKQPQATGHPVYAAHPYVSLPWHNTMRDLFLLAHELGHLAHFEVARQKHVYSNTLWAHRGAFFVEVPAMVTELLLVQHLLARTSDPHQRRWIIGQCLGTFHGIVVSLIGAHLERYLYDLTEAGTPLTLTTVMEAQEAMFRHFYGDTLLVDDGARLRWMQAPHFYFADLRQATYVVGLACGYAVIEGIHREGQPAVARWLHALEAGATLSPLQLMQLAGVDMTSPQPIQQVLRFFGSLVDELELSLA